MSVNDTLGLFSNPIPVGTIVAFAGSTPPAKWLLCDGRTLKVADYPYLYSVLGNLYGGNATNFILPNLVGSAVIGSATQSATPVTPSVTTSSLTITASNVPSFNTTVTDTGAFTASLPSAAYVGGLGFTNVAQSNNNTILKNPCGAITTFTPTITSSTVTYNNSSVQPVNTTITPTGLSFNSVKMMYMIKALY